MSQCTLYDCGGRLKSKSKMQTKINQRRAKNVGGGGAAEDFRGDHLIFGRTKEGIA